MNNENIWCRTLLTSYKALNTFSKVLDRTLNRTAMKSFEGAYCGYSTDALYSKMLEVIDRKKGLVNIKVLVDSAMKRLGGAEYEILRLRYFEGVGATESAVRLSLTERTYFRKLNKALSDFMFFIKLMGYDVKRLEEEYKKEPFIKALYQRLYKKSNLNERAA